jgi:hypothetical protein
VFHLDDDLTGHGKFQAPNIKQTTNPKRQKSRTTAGTHAQAQARGFSVTPGRSVGRALSARPATRRLSLGVLALVVCLGFDACDLEFWMSRKFRYS